MDVKLFEVPKQMLGDECGLCGNNVDSDGVLAAEYVFGGAVAIFCKECLPKLGIVKENNQRPDLNKKFSEG